MKGSYILLIKLSREKSFSVGKLGYIHFPEAFYAYVGSAMNGIEARLAHHLGEKKKPHWHIDYLLNEAEVLEVILCPSEPFTSCHSDPEPFASCHSERSEESHDAQDKLRKGEESHRAQGRLRVECFLAQTLAEEFQSIPCFGASDCKCNSHLYLATDKDRLRAKVIEAVDRSGFASCHCEPKAWQSHSKRS